jgi:hypothetical protein
MDVELLAFLKWHWVSLIGHVHSSAVITLQDECTVGIGGELTGTSVEYIKASV